MPPETRMRRRISDTLSCTSPRPSANTATPRTLPPAISGSATSPRRPRRGEERLAPEPRRLGRARRPAGGERGLGDRLHVVDLDAAAVGVGEHEQRLLVAAGHAEDIDLRAR